jgi:hypothetical protein
MTRSQRGSRFVATTVCRRWTVSYRWEGWRNEVPWMSLYFTFGVWSSIWLVYASLAIER